MISLLKLIYNRNKFWFIIAILVVAVFIISACSSGTDPPSGPIGGGC